MKQSLLFGLAAVGLIAGTALAQQAGTSPAPIEDAENTRRNPAEPVDVEATDTEDDLETVELPQIRYDQFGGATLRALDKITGRSTDMEIEVGTPIVFGSLLVALKACYQTPPELPPEAAAFLEVDGVQATQAQSAAEAETLQGDAERTDEDRLFSGWMFASSPGLSALEHPVYDIWVIRCKASAPVNGASGE